MGVNARLRQRLCSLAVLLCAPALSVAAPWRAVEDAPYGAALYQFFQGDYANAGVELLAAQQQGRLPRNADQAELLLGGIYLEYGMHRSAEQIFQRLTEQGVTPELRQRAWLSLATLRYRRGLYDKADEALGHLDVDATAELRRERLRLEASLALARQRPALAVRLLDSPVARKLDDGYLDYNLAIALFGSRDEVAGLDVLGRLGTRSAKDEEQHSLRDLANLTAGERLLAKGDMPGAQNALRRVRLEGPYSVTALLELGDAFVRQGRWREALGAWQALPGRAEREDVPMAVWLRIAAVRERAGDQPGALQAYRDALKTYAAEQTRLRQAGEALAAGDWLGRWEGRAPSDPGLAALWRYLPGLLASHRFQQAWQDLEDLRRMEQRLLQAQADLPAFATMLEARRGAYAQALPRLGGQVPEWRLQALQTKQAQLTTVVDQLGQAERGATLADAGQKASLKRLERVGQRLQAMPEGEARQGAEQRYRLLKGVLEWDLSQAYPARLWAARKRLRENDQALEQAVRQLERLQRAQHVTPTLFDGYQQRFDQLAARVDAGLAQSRTLQQRRRDELLTLVQDWLQQRQTVLQVHQDRARYALAHLLDEAASRSEVRP